MSKPSSSQMLSYETTPCAYNPGADGDISTWLKGHAGQAGKEAWLLAFADDGVTWGRVDSARGLTTSRPLDASRLQTLHLFGEDGELRLWRDGTAFQGAFIHDLPEPADRYFDQGYILWGDHVENPGSDFSLVADGAQGLQHAVPLDLHNINLDNRPLRLFIRNHLAEDPQGQAYVCCSRLLRLQLKKGGEK